MDFVRSIASSYESRFAGLTERICVSQPRAIHCPCFCCMSGPRFSAWPERKPFDKARYPFVGLGGAREGDDLEGVDPFENLADLVLKENDQQHDEHLPENLEDPGRKEESPRPRHCKDNSQDQKSRTSLECLCSQNQRYR